MCRNLRLTLGFLQGIARMMMSQRQGARSGGPLKVDIRLILQHLVKHSPNTETLTNDL